MKNETLWAIQRQEPNDTKCEGNYGYNAATGIYTYMIEAGILDPTKVVRSALQNPALMAGFLFGTLRILRALRRI